MRAFTSVVAVKVGKHRASSSGTADAQQIIQKGKGPSPAFQLAMTLVSVNVAGRIDRHV